MPVLSRHPSSWPELLELWQAADDLDVFESGWVFDHFSPVDVGATGPCFEAWTMMTALAQATHRVRIGAMVLAVARRHPALLAQMALTLDTISGGRIELGIGAGWSPADHHAHGVDLGTPKDRADRLDDGCAVLVRLLVEAGCGIPPVQKPHPPICIGGRGERRTLRTAARWSQHWNFPGKQVDEFARKRSLLRRYCADVGRDPGDVRTSVTLAEDPSDRGATSTQAAAFAAAGADLVIVTIRPPYRPRALERLAADLGPLR